MFRFGKHRDVKEIEAKEEKEQVACSTLGKPGSALAQKQREERRAIAREEEAARLASQRRQRGEASVSVPFHTACFSFTFDGTRVQSFPRTLFMQDPPERLSLSTAQRDGAWTHYHTHHKVSGDRDTLEAFSFGSSMIYR
jgi:hypothetical protein